MSRIFILLSLCIFDTQILRRKFSEFIEIREIISKCSFRLSICTAARAEIRVFKKKKSYNSCSSLNTLIMIFVLLENFQFIYLIEFH